MTLIGRHACRKDASFGAHHKHLNEDRPTISAAECRPVTLMPGFHPHVKRPFRPFRPFRKNRPLPSTYGTDMTDGTDGTDSSDGTVFCGAVTTERWKPFSVAVVNIGDMGFMSIIC